MPGQDPGRGRPRHRPPRRLAARARHPAQLLDAGLSRTAIEHRLRSGRLHRRHRGVYSVGAGGLSPTAEDHAAVLACAADTVLGLHSAAASHHMLLRPTDAVHLIGTVRGARLAGIVRHRTGALPEDDVVVRFGIPTTTLERTLLDLAAVATERELELALNEARIRYRLDAGALLARSRGRPGAARLAVLLSAGRGFTRSEAERALLRLLHRAALPRPRTNVRVGPYEVDALWEAERVVAEVDGYAVHGSRPAFERDRLRDGRLRAAGYAVVRLTWRQLTQQPEAAAATLGAVLVPKAA